MRIGIIGFGGTYLKTIAQRTGDRVVARCDLDLAAVHALADAHGVETRTSDVAELLAGHRTGGEVDDFASAVLRLENDVILSVQCSYVAHLPSEQTCMEYEIYGTAGGAFYRLAPDGARRVIVGRTSMVDGTWADLGDTDMKGGEGPAPLTIIDDFLDAVRDRRETLVTGAQVAVRRDLCHPCRYDAMGTHRLAFVHSPSRGRRRPCQSPFDITAAAPPSRLLVCGISGRRVTRRCRPAGTTRRATRRS